MIRTSLKLIQRVFLLPLLHIAIINPRSGAAAFTFNHLPTTTTTITPPRTTSEIPTTCTATVRSRAKQKHTKITAILPSTTTTVNEKSCPHQVELNEQPLSYSLYLFSLRWRGSSSSKGSGINIISVTSYSKATVDIWKWKDAVLGDGRDYFVPKPKTLYALQSAIIEQINSNNNDLFKIKECTVLSNCARFEILLAVDATTDPKPSRYADNVLDRDKGTCINESLEAIIKTEITKVLLLQVHAYQHRRKRNPLLDLQLNWDSPDCIVANQQQHKQQHPVNNILSEQVRECRDSWAIYNGPYEIANHLCHIAAGMASRPRRPDRLVQFRPFSSRDAHILLQLKRALDTSTKTNMKTPKSSNNTCAILLKHSLTAGKAARNVNKVPEIGELKCYGTGDNSKYSTEPPVQLSEYVQEAVIRRVIDPTVQQAVDSLLAQEHSQTIQNFRERAEALAMTGSREKGNVKEDLQFIRQRIHKPTLQLRTSKLNNCTTATSVIVESLLEKLESELDEHRRSKV